MILKQGNMWSRVGSCSIVLFGANSTVNTDRTGRNRLVMGGGAAKEALDIYAGSDEVFGNMLVRNNLVNGYFGLMIPYAYPNECLRNGTVLGAIQTKIEVWKPSTLELVEYSVNLLHALAHNWESVVTHVPGAGLGGLSLQDVMPLIETLPDNVEVWAYGGQRIAQNLQIADEVTQKLIGQPLTASEE